MRPETEEILQIIERLTAITERPMPQAFQGQVVGTRGFNIQSTVDMACNHLQTIMMRAANPVTPVYKPFPAQASASSAEIATETQP